MLPEGIPALDDLRRAIDRIDNSILDLLIERAAMAEQVAAAKTAGTAPGTPAPAFIRPGREMSILKRLLSRHRGHFPKTTVIRIWREIFAAMLSLESPLKIAVFMPARGAGFLELARDQFGAYTPTLPLTSATAVVQAVADGTATAGVVPLPRPEDDARWWPRLASPRAGTPFVVSRVPVLGPGSGRGDGVEALSIAGVAPDPTGRDRSLLIVEAPETTPRLSVKSAILHAGFTAAEIIDSTEADSSHRQYLIEIAEFVAVNDHRLTHLPFTRATVIGGYAVPFTPADLLEPSS